MKQNKKLTISAIMVALGTVLIVLGGYIGIIDLTVCALASLLVVFVYIEIGSPYTWLVWICTTLTTFLFLQGKIILPLMYFLAFGLYPILKAYIERLPRKLWLLIKLPYVNAVIWIVIKVWEFIYQIPIFTLDGIFKNLTEGWLYAIMCIILNIAFIAYDLFLTVMVRVYFEKFRNRFKHLLK